MSNEESRARGERAAQLLNDPLLVEAFGAVDAFATKQALEHADAVERERWRLLLLVGRKYRDALRSYITDGKIAAAEILKAEQKAERETR
jgi:hypothetical protein